jgi:HlyD family secretion protein
MATTHDDIDLKVLARPAQPVPPPRRRWLWSLVPVVILAGFLLIFLQQISDLFTEAIPVTVVRPRAAEGVPTGGATLFQAAGWVEPDPYPVRVAALAAGVVEEMLVDEAMAVKKGDPLCKLVAEDAQLAVAAAEATLARTQAQAEAARVEHENAKASFAAALEVTEARDLARALLEGHEAEAARLASAVAAGKAAVRVAEKELATQQYLHKEKAVGPWQLELAEAKAEEARSKQAVLEATHAKARAEVEQASVRLHRAVEDYRLRFEERLRVDTAKVMVAQTQARVAEAKSLLEIARLRLSRMTVVSPVAGVVLTRDASPGTVVGPSPEASSVVHLYDPKRLRVRVDVPQAKVAGASVGQRAEVRCDVRRDRPYHGKVLRIVEVALIDKVTLEVQVRILDPDHLLKPDMLCQVSVFREDTGQETSLSVPVRIEARCLVGADTVWVVDGQTGRATRRRVRTGLRSGQDIVILQGLNLTDKVIASGFERLAEGAQIRIEEGR